MAKSRRPSPFYVISVATAVILFWRGMWGLLDLFIFPGHELTSYITSVVLGVTVLVLTHRLTDGLM